MVLGLVSSRFRIQRLLLNNFCSQVKQTEAILSNISKLSRLQKACSIYLQYFVLLGCAAKANGLIYHPSIYFTHLHLEKKRVLISSQIFDSYYDVYAEVFLIQA